MAHVGTTPNLGLPVWNGGDKPEMADFNDAFSKIDADGVPVLSGSGNNRSVQVKCANGVLLTWGRVSYQAVITSAYGSVYQNQVTINFPTGNGVYVEPPEVFLNTASTGVIWGTNRGAGSTTSKVDYYIVSPVSIDTALTVVVSYLAVGRWK